MKKRNIIIFVVLSLLVSATVCAEVFIRNLNDFYNYDNSENRDKAWKTAVNSEWNDMPGQVYTNHDNYYVNVSKDIDTNDYSDIFIALSYADEEWKLSNGEESINEEIAYYMIAIIKAMEDVIAPHFSSHEDYEECLKDTLRKGDGTLNEEKTQYFADEAKKIGDICYVSDFIDLDYRTEAIKEGEDISFQKRYNSVKKMYNYIITMQNYYNETAAEARYDGIVDFCNKTNDLAVFTQGLIFGEQYGKKYYKACLGDENKREYSLEYANKFYEDNKLEEKGYIDYENGMIDTLSFVETIYKYYIAVAINYSTPD